VKLYFATPHHRLERGTNESTTVNPAVSPQWRKEVNTKHRADAAFVTNQCCNSK
jgi:hypothetical protein